MFLLLTVCAWGEIVVINREPSGHLHGVDANLFRAMGSHFWTEYGTEWRNLVPVNADKFRSYANYLEERTDVQGVPGARYMFFGIKDNRRTTELFLLSENDNGEVVMSYTSGRSVRRHRVTGASFEGGRLTFTYGRGLMRGSFKSPRGANQQHSYYQEIFNFYEHVFCSKFHGFTRSDFLAWSAKHSLGVPKEKFEQLGELIAAPVKATLTAKNCDFLAHWFGSPISDKRRIDDVLSILANNNPKSIISLLRATMMLDGLPHNSDGYLRGNAGAAIALPAICKGDRTAQLDIADLIFANPNLQHVPDLLTNGAVISKFLSSKWWRLATLVAVRMAHAIALQKQSPTPAVWPRIVFATAFGLRTVGDALSVRHQTDGGPRVWQCIQTELNRLTNVTRPSWFFDAPVSPPRSDMWLNENDVPTLRTATLPEHWTIPPTTSASKMVVRFLTDMCCDDSSIEESRVNRTYKNLIGDQDWTRFAPLAWRRWNSNRMLAERGLFTFVQYLDRGLGVTTSQQEEGVASLCTEGRRGGQSEAATGNIEEELLNVLKTLSRDLRHSRRHNRYHRRW